jgi:hypothetical protein
MGPSSPRPLGKQMDMDMSPGHASNPSLISCNPWVEPSTGEAEYAFNAASSNQMPNGC